MKRFEIQEMVSQSDQGVTYLAYDKEARSDVALRRFFAYGSFEAAFGEEQQDAYLEMCLRLMRIKHLNLRVVVGGGIDPADKTPYLVTEWVRGQPLNQILGGATMDPSSALDVVRAALNASLELSEAFGQEAVWVDTMPDSIIVAEEPMGRGYTFWVCTSRWFSANPKLREVSSVALMAEKLVGWNTQFYSKEAAGGFGGWVQEMKSTPGINLRAALEQLDALIRQDQHQPTADPGKVSTGAAIPPGPRIVLPRPVPNPGVQPIPNPGFKFSTPHAAAAAHTVFGVSTTQAAAGPATSPQGKSKSLFSPMMVIAACIAVTAVFVFLVQRNRANVRDHIARNEALEQANAKKLAEMKAVRNSNPQIPSPAPSRPIDAERKVTAVDAAHPKPEITKSAVTDSSAEMGAVPVFSADQVDDIRKRGNGKPVKLIGTLVAVNPTEKIGGVRLWFDTPQKKGRAYARAVQENFEGELGLEMFQHYVGKRIVVEGACFYEKNWPVPHRVDFTRASQVYLADD